MTSRDRTSDAKPAADNSCSRRLFLAAGLSSALLPACAPPDDGPSARQAGGVKVGEVTDSTAVVWARLTARSSRNAGAKVVGKATAAVAEEAPRDVAGLDGACPGAAGRVRVRF